MIKKITFLFFALLLTINAQELVNEKEVGPGVIYKIYMDKSEPLYVGVLEVDLTNPDLKVNVGIANDTIGNTGEKTSSFAQRNLKSGEFVLGAVNGDFFGEEPLQAENNMASEGNLYKAVSHRNRSSLLFDKENKPHTGVYKYSGFLTNDKDTIILNAFNSNKADGTVVYDTYGSKIAFIDSGYTGYNLINQGEMLYKFGEKVTSNRPEISGKNMVLRVPEKKDIPFKTDDNVKLVHSFNGESVEYSAIISGLPGLLKDGRRPETYIGSEGIGSESFVGKNPRTAVGYSKDKERLYIVAVDGRNPAISMGMTLTELADFMTRIGAYEAVNLDGGGSTTLVVRDEIMNNPTDVTGERPVHNFLYVSSVKPAKDYLSKFAFAGDTLTVKKNTEFTPEFKLFDDWGLEVKDTTIKPVFSLAEDERLSSENKISADKFLIKDDGYYIMYGGVEELKDTVLVEVK